jgi:GTP-binding protein
MSMLFTINDLLSLERKEGKFVTLLEKRLTKELEKNLAMKLGETDSADKFMVLVVVYCTCLFLLKQ